MRVRLVAIAGSMSLMLASSTFAFDGSRKGFVFGGVLGAGYMTIESTTKTTDRMEYSDDASGLGPCFRLEIGHAPNPQLVISWESRICWFGDSYRYATTGRIRSADTKIMAAVSGPALVHFSKEASPSFFVGGGPAIAFVTDETDFVIFGRPSRNLGGLGPAFLLKSGYEFNRHFNFCFETVLCFPRERSDAKDVDGTLFSISATINWLGY